MANEPSFQITLGADVGGSDAYDATNDHVLKLRKSLGERCLGPYSETIREIALVLRIDGAVQAWGKTGAKVMAMRTNAFVTADIFVPAHIWKDQDITVLQDFLGGGIRLAISEIGDYVARRGYSLNREGLERDIDLAVSTFERLAR